VRYVEAAGLRVSKVGLGAWQFGSSEWGYGRHYAEAVAPAIVRRSLEAGVNLVDTAELYGFGRSERIVGRALGDRRDEWVVATKLFPVVPVDPVVRQRARASLRRLGTDRVDLYQLHWPNPVVPLGATMAALGRLQADGLIRHVGVSNFSLEQWRAAEAALGAPVVTNQVRYSLLDRRPEAELVPHAAAGDRIVVAYSPLGQGLLSGRYDEEHRPGGWRGRTPAFLTENLRRLRPLLDVMRQVAAAHDATCAQVALAWLVRQPNVVVIPGAASVDQAVANAEAADLELSDDEDAALRAASGAYRPVTGPAALLPMAAERAARVASRVRTAARALRS